MAKFHSAGSFTQACLRAEDLAPTGPYVPEKALVQAMVHRAFCDALSGGEHIVSRQALVWFESDNDGLHSFLWCVDCLGWERSCQPNFLRAIQTWKARGLSPQRNYATKTPRKPIGSE